jgi:WD40 repeat protein
MNINSMDILSPFEPPHLDSVTGLAVIGNKLISGSKDKNIRLWSLDHSVNNARFTLHLFNDYVNTVTSMKKLN